MANDFQPVVGHRFQFRTDPGPLFDGILDGEVVLVDRPQKLAHTFIGGSMNNQTTVTWTLTPRDDGTVLRLDHTGFTGLSDIAISGFITFGWGKMLKKLQVVLESLAEEGPARDDSNRLT